MRRRRSVRVAVLLVLLLAVTAGVVYAGFEACGDPVIDVAGNTLQIEVAVDGGGVDVPIDRKHPIRVTVEVPSHLVDDTSRIDKDKLFLVDIRGGNRRDRIDVRVDAPEFPELRNYRVRVTVDFLGSQRTKRGWSNRPIQIRITDPAIRNW